MGTPTPARADKPVAKAPAAKPKSDKARIAQLEAQVASLKKQLAAAQQQLAQGRVAAEPKEKKPVPAVLNFTMQSLEGKPVALSQYAGKTIMIVNTASKCGNTPQYEGLEKLYKKYQAQGFVVLGFPSGDFAGQELGTDGEIAQFCEQNYGVSFPMFSKVKVKGEGKVPLYQYLTGEATNPDSPGEIDWNFAKFIIDPSGKIAARFKAGVQPESPEVVAAIEKALPPAA